MAHKSHLWSLIILLQTDTKIKLEVFLTGGDVDWFLMDILRKLTTEQLEEISPQ